MTKINEIAQQAGLNLTGRVVHCTTESLDKFAKLLVQDCITICENIGKEQDGHVCADKIKERFSEDSN
jgi:folate-dependent phosphoribosylglycinamide formyltransferase PurN